jgi:hypothetical protein
MNGKRIFLKSVSDLFIIISLAIPNQVLRAEDSKQSSDCVDTAFKRIREIQSLPEMKYLNTLDGQTVLLNEFYDKCILLFPKCSLYRKFYYWQSEIREVASSTKNGLVKHKIRSYHNCISASCLERCDPRKTHGDVAEFYDQQGNFMGLAVYVKEGKYCSLPYDGYKNEMRSLAASNPKTR